MDTALDTMDAELEIYQPNKYNKAQKLILGPSFWLSSRFGLVVLGFFGMMNLYALRVNLSVALVCMVNYSAIAIPNGEQDMSSLEESCGFMQENVTMKYKDTGEFAWAKHEQGLILGAFFWGYMITELPGGMLAERFGGKHVYLWHMLAAALCTLLIPVAATAHYIVLIVLRIIIGLGEGVAFPSMHAMWSQWAPPMERSRLAASTYAGAQLGIIITFPFTGFLCHTAGWSSVFYIFGSCGILWCMAWFFLVSNSPAQHGRISPEELEYISASLKGQVEQDTTHHAVKTPWLQFVKSGPVWAIIVGHTCANFGTYLVLTSLPTFMKEVLNFDIKSNGLFSAVPYIAYFVAINVAGVSADWIRERRYLTTTGVRKLMMLFSLCGQAVFLVGTGYCNCGQELTAVALITVAQGISGFQYAGMVVNHVDIAPRFAGTLFGISNTFATISGIVAPSIAAALTSGQSREEWRSVFWVSAAVLVFGAAFYAALGSGELQSWARVTSFQPVNTNPTTASQTPFATEEILLAETFSPPGSQQPED